MAVPSWTVHGLSLGCAVQNNDENVDFEKCGLGTFIFASMTRLTCALWTLPSWQFYFTHFPFFCLLYLFLYKSFNPPLTFFNVRAFPASGQDNTWLREGCTVIKDWFTVTYVPYHLFLSKFSETEQSPLNACVWLQANLFSHACNSKQEVVCWTTDNLSILLVSHAFSLHQIRAFVNVMLEAVIVRGAKYSSKHSVNMQVQTFMFSDKQIERRLEQVPFWVISHPNHSMIQIKLSGTPSVPTV